MAQLVMDFPEVKRYKATFKDTIKGADVIFFFKRFTFITMFFICFYLILAIDFALKVQCGTKNTTHKNFMVQLWQLIIKRLVVFTILRG